MGQELTPAVPPKLTYKNALLCHTHYNVCVFCNAAPLRQHYSNLQGKLSIPNSLFRTALSSPFGKGFVPHSHHLRLSLTKLILLTTLGHRFIWELYTRKNHLSICIFLIKTNFVKKRHKYNELFTFSCMFVHLYMIYSFPLKSIPLINAESVRDRILRDSGEVH